MESTTGWVWDERYAWHDARGMMDTVGPEAMFEPEPSLESGQIKRRLRNLVDASGLLARLVSVAPRPASEQELLWLHDREYIEMIRAASAGPGGDAGRSTPFGRGTYEIAALAAGGCIEAVDAVVDGTVGNAYALVRPPATTPGRPVAAATACSPTRHWRPSTCGGHAGSSGWRSSTGTSITATAPRTASGTTRRC